MHNIQPSLTHSHSLTHPLTHSPTHTHTQSLTHSLPHSLPPSLTHPLTHFTSLHFTSFHFTHSLTHSHTSSSSCASDVYQPQGMQKEFTKCAAALERVQNITLGQRKYGEHTIVLIVCREKNIRAWWNSMKAKQLTHKQLTLRTYIHRYLNTYIHTYLPIYLPTYIHTTIVPPSLLSFLFPSRFLCSV